MHQFAYHGCLHQAPPPTGEQDNKNQPQTGQVGAAGETLTHSISGFAIFPTTSTLPMSSVSAAPWRVSG
jgi:hypothetical protein